MSTPSIVVEGISKRFELQQARTGSFRDILGRRQAGEQRPQKDFWALNDISFTVEPGHPLAIIGHNGSGKSTMLKLLTGILKPTKGNISVHGRIGALIEVGAGFHPDLTGRENVYLNGSILGATRREIDSKFDQIVMFAGLERFIDTPVKRYSSGMFMRLGFSIAAHLEPEILLIDEVLAVGDAQFQSRCLGFLKRFVEKGGSVVFVSHAMPQVQMLCDRVLWLDHGQAMGFGEAAPLIEQYENLVAEREDAEFHRLYPEEWAERERQKERAERLGELLERRDAARVRRAQARAARKTEQLSEGERLLAERERLRELEQNWEKLLQQRQEAVWLSNPSRGRITGVRLCGEDGVERTHFRVEESLRVEIDYRLPRPLPRPTFCVEFFRESDDLHLFTTSNYDHGFTFEGLGIEGTITMKIPFFTVNAGQHYLRLRLYSDWKENDWDSALEDTWDKALTFQVDAGRFGHGPVYVPVCWERKASARK
ncbi:MAG: ABC transporter ATP-binding protein [Armatimonas sp.]